jgi:hypothetical protein
MDSPLCSDDRPQVSKVQPSEVLLATGAFCAMPACGAFVVAYRSADRIGCDNAELWAFTCPRCGIDFTVPEDELVFLSRCHRT